MTEQRSKYSRLTFVTGAGLCATTFAFATTPPRPVFAADMQTHAQSGLDRLLEGNARFVADRAKCPPLTARRLELVDSQSPFAVILSCSDSRVPVDIVFDQEPGNIFGVRVAGNFVDPNGLGSIEYSVAVLKSSLVLVLGHTDCGAVKAAVKYVKDGKPNPGHIQEFVSAVAPAARAAKDQPGDWVANAILQNVHDNVAALASRSTIIADAVKNGSLAIAGGIYDLHSGKVTTFGAKQ